jgi:hypothetical protein
MGEKREKPGLIAGDEIRQNIDEWGALQNGAPDRETDLCSGCHGTDPSFIKKESDVSEHAAPNLGSTPDAAARRDAVHVAVAPVVAVSCLKPGDHVGLQELELATADARHIGVVDPFRRDPVKPGERFWLFLYPGSVTTLRHVWTHPGMSDEG